MQSELAVDGPAVNNADMESSAASDTSRSHDPVENHLCESVQNQPGAEEKSAADISEIANNTDAVDQKSATDVADNSCVQPSAVTSPQPTTTVDVSGQLAVLHSTVRSLRMSNDELRQMVSDGMTKVGELEVAYAASVARNKELEKELARLRDSTERTVGDVALLSTSLAQMSTRVDKQIESNATSAVVDGNAAGAAGEGTDMSSLQPTIDQRVSELELQMAQSTTRFGEFASALDNIERDLQRYIRRHSLVVENLCPKEDRSASEAFLVFVNSLLGITIDDSDIDGLHLLDRTNEDATSAANNKSPDKKDHRPRPILITFTCYRTRTQVYKVYFSMCTHTQTHISTASFLDSLYMSLPECERILYILVARADRGGVDVNWNS